MRNENHQSPVLQSTLWILFFIVLIGAFLRIYPLKHEALSGDELFSARVALAPINNSYVMVRDDLVHPPLYYLLLKIGISTMVASALGLLEGNNEGLAGFDEGVAVFSFLGEIEVDLGS